MNVPTVNLVLMCVGGLVSAVGTIALIIVAFRRSILWGLGVLFVPFVNIIFVCLNWAGAKTPFLASFIGWIVMCVGIFTVPEVKDEVLKAMNKQYGLQVKEEKKAPDLNAQIAEHRQRLEALQATFAQDGVELTKQYQTLEAQRKGLKTADTAAVMKFNEAAAGYQARNAARQKMQQEIDTTQKELDALLDKRSREAAAAAAGKKG